MRIVLDSSIFVSTNFLRSAQFEAILRARQSLHLSFLVPEVVYEEVCELYGRNLLAKYDSYRRAGEDLSRSLDRPIMLHESEGRIVTIANSFRLNFGSSVPIRDLLRIPYPDITHKATVQAAVSKRKPFDKGNDGYRDFMLWLSIVGEYQRTPGEPIFFVSHNRNDFAADPRANADSSAMELHQDFLADLRSRNLPVDAVVYYASLEAFRTGEIKPRQQSLEKLARELLEGTTVIPGLVGNAPIAIANWLATHFSLERAQSLGLSRDAVEIEAGEVSEVIVLGEGDIREIDHNTISVDLVVSAKIQFALRVSSTVLPLPEVIGSDPAPGESYKTEHVSKQVRFIFTSIVDKLPSWKVIRSDAILIPEGRKFTFEGPIPPE